MPGRYYEDVAEATWAEMLTFLNEVDPWNRIAPNALDPRRTALIVFDRPMQVRRLREGGVPDRDATIRSA